MTKLGDYVKQKRFERRLTQGQLSIYSGINRAYISQIESGERDGARPDTLKKLAKGLKVEDADIFKAAGILADEIQVTSSKNVVTIYGTIFAGEPSGAEEDISGEIQVPDVLIEKYGAENLIALKISGDSMNNVIPNGAIAILNTKYEPIMNGHIYATLINDTEATLKRVFKYKYSVRFEPDSNNPKYEPWTYNVDSADTVDYVGELVYYMMEIKGE